MTELEKQITNLPPFIKQWYKTEAERRGQKTTPYASLILIEYALANGAQEKNESSKIDTLIEGIYLHA